MRNTYTLLLLIAAALTITRAQENRSSGSESVQDSLPNFSMETVVVTADRSRNKIANSTSAVSVLTADEIHAFPAMKLADVLGAQPGFFVVNKDGMGRDPIVTSRGFYGGGEAEYLLVLLDGKPINDLETGLVNWNLVPVKDISSVEISRGASSPLYGDVALAGVMNIFTRGLSANNTSVSVDGGSYGIVSGEIQRQGLFGTSPYKLSLANERTDGSRDHSSWKATTFNGNIDLPVDETSNFHIVLNGQWLKSNDPGPLSQSELDANRIQSTPYYKADGKDENRQSLSIEHRYHLSGSSEFSSMFYFNHRSTNAIRTYTTPGEEVSFDPSFSIVGVYDTTMYGDTKERELHANEYGIDFKYSAANGSGSFRNKVVIGIDGSYGKISSTYYDAFKGFENDYENNSPARDTIVADGDATRGKAALYTSIEQRFSIPLTISMGGRYDILSDKYAGRVPDTVNFSGKSSAASLKYGVNYKYSDNTDNSGNVYISVNRSFKAPTLDQLSDQRPIDAAFFAKFYPGGPYTYFPTTFPPFSNNSLKPQTAVSYDVGIYQRFKPSDGIYTEHSISYYKTDMTDEIDFDLNTLRYRNIQNSRHVGIEFGNKFYLLPSFSGFINYTWTSVKFASGSNEGNYLKAIPRNVIAAGVTYNITKDIRASLDWNFVNDTYMDDENTLLLGNYNFGNAKFSYLIGRVTVYMDVQNLLNKEYNSTGYILYGTPLYLPASGRILHGGLSLDI